MRIKKTRSKRNGPTPRPANVKYWYSGKLCNKRGYNGIPREVARAHRCFRSQIARCYYRTDKFYKNYGGRGLTVKYSPREFVGWWLKHIVSFDGDIPSISRINNDNGYFFGNIKIEEMKENSRESMLRNKKKIMALDKKVRCSVLDAKTHERLFISESISDAAILTENTVGNVWSNCEFYKRNNGKRRYLKGFTFEYAAL